jgi:hypothetical protein
VSEPGQRVVLADDRDPRAIPAPAATVDGTERRSQAAGWKLNLEAVATQELRDPGRGLDLFERHFGVGMDPMRQIQDFLSRRFDRSREPALGRVSGSIRTAGAGFDGQRLLLGSENPAPISGPRTA